MIRPLETQHLSRPDITALYPVDRGAVLRWLSQLVATYNPWVRPFGAYSVLLDPTITAKLYQEVRTLSLRRTYGNQKLFSQEKVAGMDVGEWKSLPETLAAGLVPIENRVALSDVVVGPTASGMRSFKPFEELKDLNLNDGLPFRLSPGLKYVPVLSETTAMSDTVASHIRLTLLLQWENIIASGHIVNIPAAPEGVEQQSRAQIARSSRLFGLIVALQFSLRAAGLRPYARIAREPAIRARLLLEGGPGTEEQLAILEEMAALPIHPWMAIADSIGLPGRNKTPWNAVSATLGIDSHLWAGMTGNGEGNDRYEHDPLLGIDFASILTYAREMKLDYDHRRADELLALDAAGQLLGFTTGAVRPAVALYGPELEPIFTDGQLVSKAVSPLDLFFRPTLPAQRHKVGQMKWIGDVTVLEADEVFQWLDAEHPVVYIEREDVPFVGEFALQRLAGRMLRPVAEWMGGEYVAAPATIEGIASIFGLSTVELTKRIAANAALWADIADVTAEGKVTIKKADGDAYYVSARTRTPGLVPVELPRSKGQLELAALQWGYVVAKERARAMYIRDMEVPAVSVDMASKLVELARSLIGRKR